jgi:hypothetical protein
VKKKIIFLTIFLSLCSKSIAMDNDSSNMDNLNIKQKLTTEIGMFVAHPIDTTKNLTINIFQYINKSSFATGFVSALLLRKFGLTSFNDLKNDISINKVSSAALFTVCLALKNLYNILNSTSGSSTNFNKRAESDYMGYNFKELKEKEQQEADSIPFIPFRGHVQYPARTASTKSNFYGVKNTIYKSSIKESTEKLIYTALGVLTAYWLFPKKIV